MARTCPHEERELPRRRPSPGVGSIETRPLRCLFIGAGRSAVGLVEPIGPAIPDGVGSLHLADRAWIALRICSLTASKLKLAPFCIGGNSTNVSPTLTTSCWT